MPRRDLAEVVRGADVVVTVTPAREPLVKDEWIAPGTHIAAVGADKSGRPGARPAHPAARAHFRRRHPPMPDRRRDQCAAVQGTYPARQDIAGEIGEVITGKKQGRRSDDEITLFDSTGIALQDSATVPLEYERAVAAGVGIEKKMIST